MSITYVLTVTDMSGSMTNLAVEVRSGFNAYIAELRKDREANGTQYRVSATVFDTEFVPLCVAADLAEVPEFTAESYAPRGMTALLDAVGKTVAEFDAKVALEPDDRVLLVIQTDGEENSSHEFSWGTVRDLLERHEKTGQWAIVYLGQGINAWAQGQRFGAHTQTINNSQTGLGTRSAYTGLAAATVDYVRDALDRMTEDRNDWKARAQRAERQISTLRKVFST